VTGTQGGSGRSTAIVAGHICLDIIPTLGPDPDRRALRPASLELIGGARLAVGGCVGNTGIALERLGLRTVLVGCVGDDALGDTLVRLVADAVPSGSALLRIVPGGATSYSLVFNRPGEDRAILHFPGVNAAFNAGDVPDHALRDAALLHVGYPPLMSALVADGGRELQALLAAARRAGAITSLDMANANLQAGETVVDWPTLLADVLPLVDVFLPSLAEAEGLLRRRVRRERGGTPSLGSLARLASDFVGLGVAIAGVKAGEHGLYVRTASEHRIANVGLGLGAEWADRELHSTVFATAAVGTVGAGDTTIAGFLHALLARRSAEDAVTAACAVGASSVEAPDGTSGVRSWAQIERRVLDGWRRRAPVPANGWTGGPDPGLRLGPRDRANRR